MMYIGSWLINLCPIPAAAFGPTADPSIDQLAASPTDQVILPFGPWVYSNPNFWKLPPLELYAVGSV